LVIVTQNDSVQLMFTPPNPFCQLSSTETCILPHRLQGGPCGANHTFLYSTRGGTYVVNELPQPQPPEALGFLKVNPDPIMVVT
jgi:hypothetical protein